MSPVSMLKYAAIFLLFSLLIHGCSPWPASNSLDSHLTHFADVTILAGTWDTRGSIDGTGGAALFSGLEGICSDGTNLFVSENVNNDVRKIVISSGLVTTFAAVSGPKGICTDGINLYVCDEVNHSIQKISLGTAAVSTLAGGSGSGTADGIGTAAQFSLPQGICTDGTNLFVADRGNYNVRQIVISSAVVTTLAGSTSGASGGSDGVGTAATFTYPTGCCIVGENLYVSDRSGLTGVRLVQIASGRVTTQRSPLNSALLDYAVYDGSTYIYSCNDILRKTDAASWYFVDATTLVNDYERYSFTAVCISGSDIFLTDSRDCVVLRLQSIK
jgi:hypothetical protein